MTEATRPVPTDARCGRRSELWYLIFLGNLVFQPAFDPESGYRAGVAAVVAVALFVPLHIGVTYRGGRIARWAPTLTTLLALAIVPFNGGATVFFIYAAAFAGGTLPRRYAYRWFTGLSLGLMALLLVVELPLPIALLVVGFPAVLVWMVGMLVLEEADRVRANERLRVDNARIEHLATAAERERLASDLHDLLGQSLTEVIVRAQLIRRLIDDDPAGAAQEAATIESSSRRALDQVREAVRGWSEFRIDDEVEVARRTLAAADIAFTLDRDPDFDPPPTTESTLALALREGITNVVRHADAGRCHIALHRESGNDVLRISDDGRGSGPREGQGLSGMRARVLAVGGELERDGGQGTSLTVRVPSGVPT